jgi:hypothetical protein
VRNTQKSQQFTSILLSRRYSNPIKMLEEPMTDIPETPRLEAAGPAEPLSKPALRPEQSIAWQSQQLVLWLIAAAAELPDTALATLGLDSATLSAIREQRQLELSHYFTLQRAARLLTREATAELLRSRLAGLSLAACTPAEVAAVVRAYRSLPEWVWADSAVDADGTRRGALHAAGPAPAWIAQAASTLASGQLPDWQGGMPSAGLVDQAYGVPLTRAERRRIQALIRKGK